MKYILVLMVILFASSSFAGESATLSAPMMINPTATSNIIIEQVLYDYKNNILSITVGDGQMISKTFNYRDTTALNMMTALNKANFTINSTKKIILNRLISDGYLVGSVVGSPD